MLSSFVDTMLASTSTLLRVIESSTRRKACQLVLHLQHAVLQDNYSVKIHHHTALLDESAQLKPHLTRFGMLLTLSTWQKWDSAI